MTERPSHHGSEPEHPSELPPKLAAFLERQHIAAVLHATDHGTVLVVKAPGQEIESVRGTVPIEMRHELYAHPAAPVIRMVTRIYDQPNSSLAFELFINVADDEQLVDYGQLAEQAELDLLFYD